MDISAVVYVLLVICQGSFQTDIGGGVLPLSPATGRAPVPGRAPDAPWRPRRFKRCSCSSLMDKECVYFCHLDIIWINTPEQTVPYGLGNTRSRRALEDKKPFTSNDRCQCSIGRDKKCKTFCQTEADLRAQAAMEKGVSTVNKEECRGLGLKCVQRLSQHNRSMKRSEMIDNNIQVSLRIAKLKASLEWMQRTRHNRTNKKQNIWERLKKTP